MHRQTAHMLWETTIFDTSPEGLQRQAGLECCGQPVPQRDVFTLLASALAAGKAFDKATPHQLKSDTSTALSRILHFTLTHG